MITWNINNYTKNIVPTKGFTEQELKITESYYFKEAYQWWLNYRDQKNISEEEQQLITHDLEDGFHSA